jgi:pimeloyl-ACP methyl ester carboxylesterase
VSGRVGIVLAHGGGHGPWTWDRVVARLAPHHVVTPDLYRGTDNPASPAVLQATVDELRADGPVIVCGHSYAGYAMSALDPESVAHLVYIAAILVDTEPWYQTPTGPDASSGLYAEDDGVVTVRSEHARALFYADCDDEVAAEAVRHLRPHPRDRRPDAVARPAWREVPTTYVCCEQDRAVVPAYQHAAAERVGGAVRWPTSHSPMLSRPDLVADLLSSIATRVAA